MKVTQIISEDESLDEAPVGMLKRGSQAVRRFFGSDEAEGEEDISDEANRLKKELSRWMGRSRIRSGQLTFDDLENFLNTAGYGGLAAAELEKAKSQKTLGQKVKSKVRATGAGAKAGVGAAKAAFKQASQESIVEQETEFLSNTVVDRILLAVVSQAAKSSTKGITKGKFAANKTATKKPKLPADVVKIISSLPKDQQQKLIAAITKTAG